MGSDAHQFQGQRSRWSGRLMLRPEVRHIFRMKRHTNFKLGTQVEYEDIYRREAAYWHLDDVMTMSMPIMNLYSTESWSISTALCVLSGNVEISSSSAVAWNGRYWAPVHGDGEQGNDDFFDVLLTALRH